MDPNNPLPEQPKDTPVDIKPMSEEEPEETKQDNIDKAPEDIQDGDNKPAEKGESYVALIFEYLETFSYALVLMILLFMYVFRYVSVDGTSMLNTLKDEDKLIISNLSYTPETGDIVVVGQSSRSKPLIKRIIATGGQVVAIDYDNWEIYVDGVLLEEEYIVKLNSPMRYEHRYPDEVEYADGKYIYPVKEGYVFLLGDNRNNSQDSRYYGLFAEREILGRVIFRMFPLAEMGKVK